MSGIKDSIKDLLSQVFGRADFADVLEDRWEYSDAFEGEVVAGEVPRHSQETHPPPDMIPATAAMVTGRPPTYDVDTADLQPAESIDERSSHNPGERAQAPESGPSARHAEPGSPPPPESVPGGTVESAPAIRLNTDGSIDTGDLIAQIAFDSLAGDYPSHTGNSSLLSGESPSLAGEAELDAIVAAAETTAVVQAQRQERRKGTGKDPILLVKRDDRRRTAQRPLRLEQARPAEAPPSPEAEGDTLKGAASGDRGWSQQGTKDQDEADTEHIVNSRNRQPPTLSFAVDEHAPLTSYDFWVLAPPPKDELRSSLRSKLTEHLEQDLDKLRSQPDEDVLLLLVEALQDPTIDLPPFPAAARRLLGSGSEEPGEDDVLDVVKSDPGLAGAVIRAANSPFYMAAAPVASLGSAVVRIGLREVRRVALAAAMASTFDVKGFEPLIDAAHFHSLTSGTSAEALSRTFSVEPGVAFLSGLLHNAGELLTYRLLQRAYGAGHPMDAPWNDRLPFVRDIALKYHCYFGAMFVEPWDLPPELEASLVYHHHPYLAGDKHEELASLIHVASATAAAATRHARSDIWQEYMSRLKQRREQDNSAAGRGSAGVDGIELVPVAEILEMLPPGFSKARIHSLIRDILLRVAASSLTDATSYAPARTHY